MNIRCSKLATQYDIYSGSGYLLAGTFRLSDCRRSTHIGPKAWTTLAYPKAHPGEKGHCGSWGPSVEKTLGVSSASLAQQCLFQTSSVWAATAFLQTPIRSVSHHDMWNVLLCMGWLLSTIYNALTSQRKPFINLRKCAVKWCLALLGRASRFTVVTTRQCHNQHIQWFS